jgi:ribosomal protein S18 acetylase RimI-like enzyme
VGDGRVHRVREVEWLALRDTRLRALADSPDAFGSTLLRETAFSDADWQEWARDAATGGTEACFLAWVEDEPVGIVGAYVEDGGDHVHLIAMWVAPDARRHGLGRALVDAIVSWAIACGKPAVRLDVLENNADAVELFAVAGFAPTGRSKQYKDRPHLTTIELERIP